MLFLKQNFKSFIIIVVFFASGFYVYHRIISPDFNWEKWNPVDYKTNLTVPKPNGKVTIVSVFATWCRDCHKEMEQITLLRSKFSADQLQIVMLADESTEKVQNFESKYEIKDIQYAKLSDSYRKLGIKVLPTVYVLDKKGLVVKVFLEKVDLNISEIEVLVQK